MGIDYDAKLFYGIEIDNNAYEDDYDEPKQVSIISTGNAICGEEMKMFAGINSFSADGYSGLDCEVRMVIDKDDEQVLIEYAKKLGVENPQPKWILGMHIG